MKLLKLLIFTIAICMMNSAYATKYKFVAMDNSIYTKMCVLAGNNEQKALRTTLRRHENNERNLANTTFCNGMLIANFAQKYHASKTFDYLKRHTYRGKLDKATNVTIMDIATRKTDNESAEEIVLVYVGI